MNSFPKAFTKQPLVQRSRATRAGVCSGAGVMHIRDLRSIAVCVQLAHLSRTTRNVRNTRPLSIKGYLILNGFSAVSVHHLLTVLANRLHWLPFRAQLAHRPTHSSAHASSRKRGFSTLGSAPSARRLGSKRLQKTLIVNTATLEASAVYATLQDIRAAMNFQPSRVEGQQC